jgi:hypothetical protein
LLISCNDRVRDGEGLGVLHLAWRGPVSFWYLETGDRHPGVDQMTEASESHDSSRQSDRQDWSEGPRLELDQLLAQLVARAQDVMAAQGRLRGLLAANQMIIGNLALPVVLRRIAQAACQLVNAQYAALGVLRPPAVWSSSSMLG